MTLHEIAENIQAGLNGTHFEGSLKFDCGDDGVIVLAENLASTTDQDTDCTIRLTQDNLSKLLSGKLKSDDRCNDGKAENLGDMSVAMNLKQLLG